MEPCPVCVFGSLTLADEPLPHPQAKMLKDPETSNSAANFLGVLAAHPPAAKAIIATDGVLQRLVAMLQPGEGAAGEQQTWQLGGYA